MADRAVVLVAQTLQRERELPVKALTAVSEMRRRFRSCSEAAVVEQVRSARIGIPRDLEVTAARAVRYSEPHTRAVVVQEMSACPQPNRKADLAVVVAAVTVRAHLRSMESQARTELAVVVVEPETMDRPQDRVARVVMEPLSFDTLEQRAAAVGRLHLMERTPITHSPVQGHSRDDSCSRNRK